jgi:hypothetical protein
MATISADPNPVGVYKSPSGATTTIAWDMEEPTSGKVFVSVNGLDEEELPGQGDGAPTGTGLELKVNIPNIYKLTLRRHIPLGHLATDLEDPGSGPFRGRLRCVFGLGAYLTPGKSESHQCGPPTASVKMPIPTRAKDWRAPTSGREGPVAMVARHPCAPSGFSFSGRGRTGEGVVSRGRSSKGKTTMRLRHALLLAATLLTPIALTPAYAQPFYAMEPFYSPGGLSYGDWAARYWENILSLPANVNPINGNCQGGLLGGDNQQANSTGLHS